MKEYRTAISFSSDKYPIVSLAMRRLFSVLLGTSILFNIIFLGTLRRSSGTYPLLSPRIFAQNANDTIINFTDLRTQLRAFVSSQKDIHAGVYFEYLPSGVSIGVNEKDNFISASLIKVPLMMGILKLIETGKLAGNTVITLTKEDLDPKFGSLWKRGAGTTLTAEEAIRLSLQQSDNTAALALDRLSSTDLIREVYNALDIPVDMVNNLPVVSPKNYSSIFRCLYLSCFLDYQGSQHVLELLSQSIFRAGLPAGVPSGVLVSHKIGMYDSPDSNKRVRLDCGIVYVPKRPYILCILGDTEKGEEDLIVDFSRQVSSQVYRFITSSNSL